MSLRHHRLYIAGSTGPIPTLADLGVTACTVTTGAQGIGGGDTMTLTVPAAVDGTLLMAVFAKASLLDPVGTVRFTGTLMLPPAQADGQSEAQTYILQGPWVHLAGIGYRQQIVVPLDATDPESTLSSGYLPLVILNQDNVTAADVPIIAQVADIAAYAIAAGAPMACVTTGLPALTPPADQQTDLWCSDAIDSQLRWCPDRTAWWDYSTAPFPTLGFRQPSTAPTASMDCLEFTRFSPSPRYDLLVSQWRLTFLGKNTTVTGTADKLWITLQEDVSTAANGSPRRVENTIELREEDSVPAGLAAALHAPFKTLTTDFQATAVSQDVDWSLTPGMQLTITGLATGSLTATVQQITRDLAAGSMEISAGFPAHLGLGDLLSLMRKTRQRKMPTYDQSFSTGQALPDDNATTAGLINLRAAVETLDGGGLPMIAARTIRIAGTILP